MKISGNGNLIWGNTLNGQLVMTGDDNMIFVNNFMRHGTKFYANDDGMNNIWYRDGRGNYWDKISDSPYLIPGTARAIDKFPLSAPYRPE